MTTRYMMNEKTYDSIDELALAYMGAPTQEKEWAVASALKWMGIEDVRFSDDHVIDLLAHDLVLAGFGCSWVEDAVSDMEDALTAEEGDTETSSDDDYLGVRREDDAPKEMRTYEVVYSLTGIVRVEAEDEQDAVRRAAEVSVDEMVVMDYDEEGPEVRMVGEAE